MGYLFEVQPFAMAKSDLSSFSVEGGAMVTYNQRFWAGASYRMQDAIILMAGINLLQNQSLAALGSLRYCDGCHQREGAFFV